MNRVHHHQALIHISADLVGGEPLVRAIIQQMNSIVELMAVSSIYKRYLSLSRADLNALIVTVIRVSTDSAVDEMLWHFKQYTKDTKAKVQLLTYDDLVVLSPQLTLPHPSLHTDHLIIRCGSEAWPHYEHPIMQKTLSEIAASASPATDAEFYMQGKTLVDF
ncbi:MAG: hypothetical protein EOP06_17945 [Proteobacteria bacterium]|nr:MAG: hypothetical protein EOP06_17945 [Pseudomonadota bacterium]